MGVYGINYAYPYITDLKLPMSLTDIGYTAFLNADELINVNFSSLTNLQVIEGGAFMDCIKLNPIDLSKCTSLLQIKTHIESSYYGISTEGAFKNCVGANILLLPRSLNTIDEQAFQGDVFEQIYLP